MEFPYWFTNGYKPYEDFVSSPQNIYVFETRDEGFVDFDSSEHEHSVRIKQALRLLYIQTIDRFENVGWPKKYASERYASLYFCLDAIETYDCIESRRHNLKTNKSFMEISDKLAEAFVWEFYNGKYIRNSKQAEGIAIIMFSTQNVLRTQWPWVISDWIEKDLINPNKYESYIKSYLGCSYCHSDFYVNDDASKRQLLDCLKKHQSLYIRMANVFNDVIRTYNIEEFNNHVEKGEDPSMFKTAPFADGSCMKLVRKGASWKLEYDD